VKQVQQQLDAAKSLAKKIKTSSDKVADDAPDAALIGIVVDDVGARVVGSWTKSKYNPGFVGAGYIHDGAAGKGEKSVAFQAELPHDGLYEVRMSYTHGSNRSPSVPVTIYFDGDQETVQVDQRQPPPIDGRFISLGRWRFRKGAGDAAFITNEGTTGHVIVDSVQFIPAEQLETKAAAVDTSDAADKADQGARSTTLQEIEAEVKRFEADLKRLRETAPPPAPLTMGVKDERETGDFRVCVRGIVHNLGEHVRRGFLTAASADATEPPAIAASQSGRRQLADWLADAANPLTARIAANRVWQHLFGNGLVRTPDNFGSTGETPSHPELLDALACRFVDLGWSHKRLIREIVLSQAYQMASAPEEAAIGDATDPENRLLWRQNRKRLHAECLRDSTLLVSGQLDLSRHGPAMREKTDSEYGYKFDSNRRSVYMPVFRNNLPDVFEVFDFADPNTPTGKRHVSTLPSQALYFMNSPAVIRAAQLAAESLLELDTSDVKRIEIAFRRTLGRMPTDRELHLSQQYIGSVQQRSGAPSAQLLYAWTGFVQALMGSVDFRYVY
jgi:hypothetical protein